MIRSLLVLMFSCHFSFAIAASSTQSVDRSHWLYFGWEGDHPKSWSFMGGAVNPGQRGEIHYSVEIAGKKYFPDEHDPKRKQNIQWSLMDGFLPSPLSTWSAGESASPVIVEIQHFALQIAPSPVTWVLSEVRLSNAGPSPQKVILHVSAAPDFHHPLGGAPIIGPDGKMRFEVSIQPGEVARFGFATVASGAPNSHLDGKLKSFGSSYQLFRAHYLSRARNLAEPVELPDQEQVNLYKSARATLWQSVVTLSGPDEGAFLFNLDSLTLGGKTIEAETFNHSHPGIGVQAHGLGQSNVENINHREWISFSKIDVPSDAKSIRFSVAGDSKDAIGGIIEVHLGAVNGPKAAACPVARTGGWQTYKTVECPFEAPAGAQDLFLVFKEPRDGKIDHQIRGSGGNPAGLFSYDRTFSHDLPNLVDQLVREGDFELARKIMESPSYKRIGTTLEQDYLDAIPKSLVPLARYLALSGDSGFLTQARWERAKASAHLTASLRQPKDGSPVSGLMISSSTLDNQPEFLLVDDFAALLGLMSYQQITRVRKDTTEEAWVGTEILDLNASLNQNLKLLSQTRGVQGYMVCLRDFCWPWWNHGGYRANWLGTSLMMSGFPWGGLLADEGIRKWGGFWSDRFDAAVGESIEKKAMKPTIPIDSWGAFGEASYGSVYNAGMGLQLLYSDKFRTLPLQNVKWLLKNPSAPMQWGESFRAGDWTVPEADYESWGLGFIQQTIQESHIASDAGGTILIGRGVADQDFAPGQAIEWKNVPVTGGGRISFRSVRTKKRIEFKSSGLGAGTRLKLNYPVLEKNICATSTGLIDLDRGEVSLPAGVGTVTIELCK